MKRLTCKFVALFGLLTLLALFPRPGLASEREVIQFTGQGSTQTETFHVPSGWGIHWEADGPIFQVLVHSSIGDLPMVGFSQEEGKRGFLMQFVGGEFYLKVHSPSNWTIRVVEILGP
ncbi:hypothetical protein [Candidatus Nitronereus thalassa]|uniref:Secreted protein n=1 Tax=Candidatus Nitronereus thalassa TaxID=3020898 RepID=A0ABU3K377_9BACT|nr:hypothetical protein [Candidatus Nitronereus thalassa]MDT7040826.1 hypothetical protein [Candidatus Nitronereus thalassa]